MVSFLHHQTHLADPSSAGTPPPHHRNAGQINQPPLSDHPALNMHIPPKRAFKRKKNCHQSNTTCLCYLQIHINTELHEFQPTFSSRPYIPPNQPNPSIRSQQRVWKTKERKQYFVVVKKGPANMPITASHNHQHWKCVTPMMLMQKGKKQSKSF